MIGRLVELEGPIVQARDVRNDEKKTPLFTS